MRVRGYLNEQSVLAIFASRPSSSNPTRPSVICQALAHKYNVSRKTIRDIWNRRSWINLTAPFDTESGRAGNAAPNSNNTSAAASEPGAHRSPPESEPSSPPSILDSQPSSTTNVDTFSVDASLLVMMHNTNAAPSMQHHAMYGDPFESEWESAIGEVDLTTMVDAEALSMTTTGQCATNDGDTDFASAARGGAQCKRQSGSGTESVHTATNGGWSWSKDQVYYGTNISMEESKQNTSPSMEASQPDGMLCAGFPSTAGSYFPEEDRSNVFIQNARM